MTRLVRGMGCLLLIAAFANIGLSDDAKAILKRTVYQPKHLNAKQLAEALAKQFKGDAEITSLTEGANAVLISATQPVTEEIQTIMLVLDRKPRLVEIEVAIFDVRVKADEVKNAPTDGDLKELNNPLELANEKLDLLHKEGKITTLKRIKLSTAENQKTRQQTGQDKPMITSSDGGGFGGGGARGNFAPAQRNAISYRSTGWTVTATPQIADDGTITVDLSVEDSQIHTPEDGVPIGNNMNASETSISQLQSKVNLSSGRATLAEGIKSQSKTQQIQTYVLVGVKLLEVPKPKQ